MVEDSRQAGAIECKEIEIMPDMVEAGLRVFDYYAIDGDVGTSLITKRNMIISVYSEMLSLETRDPQKKAAAIR
jgi:hypothetical protein